MGKLYLYRGVYVRLGIAAEPRKELEWRCGYGGVGFDEYVLGMRTEGYSIRIRERRNYTEIFAFFLSRRHPIASVLLLLLKSTLKTRTR